MFDPELPMHDLHHSHVHQLDSTMRLIYALPSISASIAMPKSACFHKARRQVAKGRKCRSTSKYHGGTVVQF